MPHPLICRSTVIANQPRNAPSFETLHPLKRSILFNAPCFETPNQMMRRFRGFGVSRLIGISRSICKSEDAANGRMRQMTRSALFHGRPYQRMRRLRGSGVISRSICKSHDAAICMIGHFTRDRQMRGWGHFTHCRRFSHMFSQTLCNFSKFLSLSQLHDPKYVIGPKL